MKNLKVLFTVLCVACATAVWGEKISNYTNIVSGQKYRIGATTSNTDYYLKVDGSKISTGTSGTAVTSAEDGTIFVFEGSGTSWTIKFDGTSYYLSLASSKANGKVNVVSSASTFTLSNNNNNLRLSIGSYSVQKNNSGTQFGSYGNTQTDVWLEPISGSTETTHYNVQWMVGGQKYTEGNPTTSVASGSKVTTLPTAPADNSLSCAEKFMGWSTQHIGTNPQDYAPADLFTTIDASPAITENTTFYAVFAKPQQNNK